MKSDLKTFLLIGLGVILVIASALVPACSSSTSTSTSSSPPSPTGSPVLSSIAISPATLNEQPLGSTQQLTATGNYTTGSPAEISQEVTWTTNPTGIVTIDSSGLATFVAVGTTQISASLSGKTSQAVTVTVIGPSSVAVVPSSPPGLAVGSTQKFSATGTYSNGAILDITAYVNWKSDATNVATISVDGIVTGVAAGAANITASVSGVTSPAVALKVIPRP